jgi:DNA-directed RNA polymerase specialized sigma24 family protein
MVAAFRTTCWTDVLQAAKSGEAREGAFAQFYTSYWDPLYAYVRRRGHSHSDAEEITQEFFVTFYTHDRLSRLTREGGRFRSFLLTAMQNFLANTWDKARAAKRGHGIPPVPLHDPQVEVRIHQTASEVQAEVIYDREWGYLVLRRATQALDNESALQPACNSRPGSLWCKVA